MDNVCECDESLILLSIFLFMTVVQSKSSNVLNSNIVGLATNLDCTVYVVNHTK